MKPKLKNATFSRLAIIMTMGLLPFSANGASLTWDGDQDGNWTTNNAGNTNWTDSAIPGDSLPVSGDTLSFGGVSNTSTVNGLSAGTTIAGINFTNDGTVGTKNAPFTLAPLLPGDNGIILGGNITTTLMTAGTLEDTISLDMQLSAARTVIAKTGHNLKITGKLSGAFTLNIGNSAIDSDGLVTLTGQNTHSLTSITRYSNVRVQHNEALGKGFSIVRQSSLALASGINLTTETDITATSGSPSQTIILDESGTATASISITDTTKSIVNSNTGSSLSLNAGDGDTLTINCPITGTGNLAKNGLGTVALVNASSTRTGNLRVNLGTLAISGSGKLGGPTSTLTMAGGNLNLAGTNQELAAVSIVTAAASGDTIHNGSLSATGYSATHTTGNAIVSANLSGPSASLTKTGAGTLTLSGTNSYLGTTTATAGSLVATKAAALPGYNIANQVTFNGGTIGVLVAGTGWTSGEVDSLLTNAIKNSGALGIDTTNGNFEPLNPYAPSSMGPLGLNKLGTNALTLSQANSYTGNTTLSAGTLNINHATALGAAGSTFTVLGGTTIDNTSGSAITLSNNNPVTLPAAGFTFGGSNNLNFGTGPVFLDLNNSATPNVITLNGSGRTLTFGGDLDSPARGNNTFVDVVGAGNTLVVGSLSLNDSVVSRNNTWRGSANVTVNGGISNGVSVNGQNFIYSGTGTFTIGGACTYFGNTAVNGVLALTAGGSLSDETNVTINNDGVNTYGKIDLAEGVSDTIKSLTIPGVNGGNPLPDGTYGSSASTATNGGFGNLDTYFSGKGVFVIGGASPYEDWAAGSFANPFTLTGPTDDQDHDGLNNLLEFVLGGDPTISQSGIAPSVVSAAGGSLVITFDRSDASQLAPAVTTRVQLSDDLTFSTPASDITIGDETNPGPIAPSGASYTVSNSGGMDTIIVTIPNGGSKNFARVVAVQP